jgi:long-chain acyl-CoA synthetase
MNRLRKLIIGIFENSFDLVAVISNNIEYTYEYILNTSKNLAETLNDAYPRRTKIALIANNSVEWIIIFIAVLLSKHTLVLFSNKQSKKKIYNILQYSRVSVLITDIKDLNKDKMFLIHDIIYVSDIEFNFNSSNRLLRNQYLYLDEESDSQGIIVFTPRKMEMISITSIEIIDTLKILNEKNIYTTQYGNYVNYQDFTYNYILCLLLPLLHGITITLPVEFATPYSLKYTLKSQITKVVILTAYQFESLWREYIENKSDFLTEFLYDFKLRKLRRWRIKRHLKNLFPNIETLIILNSEVSFEIEEILKKVKFPYTITYGTVETCGIATYSSPKNFIKGTVGKPLSDFLKVKSNFNSSQNQLFYFKLVDPEKELYKDCELEDIGNFDNDGNLKFECRTDEILNTDFGFVIPRTTERILKGINLVSDCLLVIEDDELIMVVNVDENYCDYKKYPVGTIRALIENEINQINNGVETFSKIDRVLVELTPFSRDSYGRILRDTPFIR